MSSNDWQSAEDAMSVALGFRIERIPGEPKHNQEDKYQLIHFDFAADGKRTIRAVQPTVKAAYDSFAEAVRLYVDYNAACKLSWDLYMAATGTTIDSFNGMPAGGPVEAVKAERERLLLLADQEGVLQRAAEQVRNGDGFTIEIAGVVISKADE